jgi:hypothetical protein
VLGEGRPGTRKLVGDSPRVNYLAATSATTADDDDECDDVYDDSHSLLCTESRIDSRGVAFLRRPSP